LTKIDRQSTLSPVDLSLTDEQARAMSRFMKNLGKASLYLVLLAGFILIIAGLADLITGGWPPRVLWNAGFPGATIVSLLAMLYFMTLVTIIWKRTGLKWYLVGENLIGFYLMFAAAMFLLYRLISWIDVTFWSMGYEVFVVGTLVVLWFSRTSVAQRLKRQRGIEQQRYAAHWPTLGALSFTDVFLLRIPIIRLM
jgi:hypothetical protein